MTASLDYEAALLLHYQLNCTDQSFTIKEKVSISTPKKSNEKPANDTRSSVVDASLEVLDPTPDIYHLFITFDRRFFWNRLQSVSVAWSKRMTLCAGICRYHSGGGMCTISLSEPLLRLRPRKDLVETLLHEMIHAFLFVTHNNRDRDGHGPEFHKHMHRINKEAGTNITVYHSFHDEVNIYRQHWWKCNGPCQNSKPFYGIVKRSMNRAPGPNDIWWEQHRVTCGGTFIKVQEPTKSIQRPTRSHKITSTPTISKNPITDYFTRTTSSVHSNIKDTDNESDYERVRNRWLEKYPDGFSNKSPVKSSSSSVVEEPPQKVQIVHCPMCDLSLTEQTLNIHLDECLKNSWAECVICGIIIEEGEQEEHTKKCLGGKNEYSDKDSDVVDCLACGLSIKQSKLRSHLDMCLKDVIVVEAEEIRCPYCCIVISEKHEQEHIDNCVKTFLENNWK